MSSKYATTLTTATLLLYIISISTVVLTAHMSGYEWVLATMTKENGLFESLTVVLLFVLSFLSFRYSLGRTPFFKISLALFGLVAFIAAMEEISWGQQLLHFESSEFFRQNNLQQETNLHNLVKGGLFSSFIYSCVYTVFVFAPVILRIIALKSSFVSKFANFLPPFHVSLIALFASSFQVYFYDNFSAVFDLLTFLTGLAVFGIGVSILKAWDKTLAIHYLIILASTALFMSSYKIFGFFNSQYEIREMFVVLASIGYVIYLFGKSR